jgi:hypothetical protein
MFANCSKHSTLVILRLLHHGELRPLVGESQAKKGTKKERARFTDVVGITSIDGGHFW